MRWWTSYSGEDARPPEHPAGTTRHHDPISFVTIATVTLAGASTGNRVKQRHPRHRFLLDHHRLVNCRRPASGIRRRRAALLLPDRRDHVTASPGVTAPMSERQGRASRGVDACRL
jgi:hypothetical protein